MDYKGVIIEESLGDSSFLKEIKIISTKVESVTEKHRTPWLEQWTLHTIEVPENYAGAVAEKISHALNDQGNWYVDFKNHDIHFIIFKDKVFRIDRSKPEQYEEVTKYGTARGVPEHQLDFSPQIKEWKR
jgi:hypothetical protein